MADKKQFEAKIIGVRTAKIAGADAALRGYHER